MGRPSHQPGPVERGRVEAMAGCGVPEADIARVLGIDAKTLRKHYRHELDTGHILANAKVAGSLFRKATGDGHQSVAAAIFWMKCRAGWSPSPTAPGAQTPAPQTLAPDFTAAAAEAFRQKIAQIKADHDACPEKPPDPS